MTGLITHDFSVGDQTITGIVSAEIMDSYGTVLSQKALLNELNDMIARGVAPITIDHSEEVIGRWDSFELVNETYMDQTVEAIKGHGVIFTDTYGGKEAWEGITRGFIKGLSISGYYGGIDPLGKVRLDSVHAVSLVGRPAVPIATVMDMDSVMRAIKRGVDIENKDYRVISGNKVIIKCEDKACNIAKALISEYDDNKNMSQDKTEKIEKEATPEVEPETVVKSEVDTRIDGLETKIASIEGSVSKLSEGVESLVKSLQTKSEDEGESPEDEDKEEEVEVEKSVSNIPGGVTPSIDTIEPAMNFADNGSLIPGTETNPMFRKYDEWVDKYGNREALRRHNAAMLGGEYNYINEIAVRDSDMSKMVPDMFGAFVGGVN